MNEEEGQKLAQRLGALYPKVAKPVSVDLEALKTYCPDILAGMRAAYRAAEPRQRRYFIAILDRQDRTCRGAAIKELEQARERLKLPEPAAELKAIFDDLDSERAAYVAREAPKILKAMERDLKDRTLAESIAGQDFDRDTPAPILERLSAWLNG